MSTPDWGANIWGGLVPSTISGATTNSRLLYAALRKAGVNIGPGRTPSADQLSDAIEEENRMIDGWNCQPLMKFSNKILTLQFTAQQQSYTIGIDPSGSTTADFQYDRPQEIVGAVLLLPTAADNVSKVRRRMAVWDDEQWRSIKFQAVYSYPEGLYSDGDAPLSRLYFRPIPDGAYNFELWVWQQVTKFVGLMDVVKLPPGYEDAIVNNLAVRLASYPWIGNVPMNPMVQREAIRSLAVIQSMNATSPRLRSDKELSPSEGTLNWMTGLRE